MDDAVLRFQSLASGSTGNLAILKSRRATIVLDFGIRTQRSLLQRLGDAGVGPGTVKAALVSHEHSDHLGWWGLRWCVEAKIPVLSGNRTLSLASEMYLAKAGTKVPGGLLQEVRAGATYLVEDIEVTPFNVPHDVPTLGYVLRSGRGGDRRTLVVATDLGCARPELLPWFVDADAVVLEANYDEKMLRHSHRHHADIQRVASDVGHLSNVASGRFLKEVAAASRVLPRVVLLAHLSQDHNRPDIAIATVSAESGPIGLRVPLHAAPAAESAPMIVI